MDKNIHNGERIVPEQINSIYEYLLYQRHLFAYEYITKLLSKSDKVLEIGCGEGYGAFLISNFAQSVYAIDTDIQTINHAFSKYFKQNLTFACIPNISKIENSTFDKVISLQVIEHVVDDSAFVRHAIQVLKPGGLFIITTPNRSYRLKPGQKPWYKFHVREYSKQELLFLLSNPQCSSEVKFINAPQEVFKEEMKVVKMASVVQKIDFLGLRDLIPYRLKRKIFKFMDIFNISAKNKKIQASITTSNFKVSDDEKNALDLISFCRKT